jgi:ethanolamine transporter
MDKKGVVLNSAFAVSAAFALGGHLAFTMAFDRSYLVPVIVGKLVAGVLAVIIAAVIYNIKYTENTKKEEGVTQ